MNKKTTTKVKTTNYELPQEEKELMLKHFDSLGDAIHIFCIKLKRCPSFFLQEKPKIKITQNQ